MNNLTNRKKKALKSLYNIKTDRELVELLISMSGHEFYICDNIDCGIDGIRTQMVYASHDGIIRNDHNKMIRVDCDRVFTKIEE